MISLEIILMLLLGLVVGGVLVWALLGKKSGDDPNKGLLLIQNQIDHLSQALEKKLGESSQQMHESVKTQFSESQKLIKDITAQVVQVKETNKQVVNIAEQLKTLQNILQNPKQRGVLGEYFLESVLKNVLPPDHFALQHKFQDGAIVDAVIFFGKGPDEKLLSIDSKFPMENYNRLVGEKDSAEKERLEKQFIQDIKNRIAETAKYIRPHEGTLDFAFMFIPSEAIYYDLLSNAVGAVKGSAINLIEHAFSKGVIVVSPTSFMAYLQTVLQGLRALKIEESAREIRGRVEVLGRHIVNYELFFAKLGNSLGTTVNHYNAAYKELKKIDKDVVKITDGIASVTPEKVDKPALEE